jgi:hypothetical protein
VYSAVIVIEAVKLAENLTRDVVVRACEAARLAAAAR